MRSCGVCKRWQVTWVQFLEQRVAREGGKRISLTMRAISRMSLQIHTWIFSIIEKTGVANMYIL